MNFFQYGAVEVKQADFVCRMRIYIAKRFVTPGNTADAGGIFGVFENDVYITGIGIIGGYTAATSTVGIKVIGD
jgi:hypothetical protein